MTNNKISKLKNLIQLYTNTENITNNKLAVEWLAKSYVDLLTKLNNEEISLKEFEIQYIELLEQAKEKYEHEMCLFADEYASYVQEQSKEGIKGAMVSMCAWTFFKNRRK